MRTPETRQFAIGGTVRCSDGVCGRPRRVVIEPIDRVLTHLVRHTGAARERASPARTSI
jgi:hypothetical protein